MSATKNTESVEPNNLKHPAAIIDNDLKKYLNHPVVVEKNERAIKALKNLKKSQQFKNLFDCTAK